MALEISRTLSNQWNCRYKKRRRSRQASKSYILRLSNQWKQYNFTWRSHDNSGIM